MPHKNLLDDFVQTFLDVDPKTWKDSYIIFPTLRVAQFFTAKLAQHTPAFFSPQIATLETLMKPSPDALETWEYQILFEKVLSDEKYLLLQPFSHELFQLFKDWNFFNPQASFAEKFEENSAKDVFMHESERGSRSSRYRLIDDLFKKVPTFPERVFEKNFGESQRKVIFGCFSLIPSIQNFISNLVGEHNFEYWTYDWIGNTPQAKFSKSLSSAKMVSGGKADVFSSTHKDIYQEIESVCEVAKNFIKQGIAPSSIAICITDENAYRDLIFEVIPKKFKESNIALGKPIKEFLTGKLLASFFQSFTSLKSQDHLFFWDLVFRNAQKHEVFLERTDQYSLFDQRQTSFSDFFAVIQDISPFSTDELSSFENFVTAVRKVLPKSDEQFEMIDRFLLRWKNHGEEFNKTARQHLMDLEIRSIGEPLRGIQILSLEEVRWIPFDIILVMGAADGTFPKKIPRDYLTTPSLRTSLGLPTQKDMSGMEAATFELLSAQAQVVVGSRALNYNGEESLPSKFWRGAPMLSSRSILREEIPYGRLRQPWDDGKVDHNSFFSNFTWSSRSLESLFLCPFKFQTEAQKIEPHNFFKDKKVLDEGNELHSIITQLLDQLLLKKTADISLSKLPLYMQKQFELYSWPWIRDYFQEFLKQVYPTKIETHQEVAFEIFSNDHQWRGRVDYVIETPDFYWVIDFKRKSIPTRKDVAAGKKPQLILYTQAWSANQKATVASYLSILSGECSHYLYFDQENLPDFFMGQRSQKLTAEESWKNLVEKLNQSIAVIKESGKFNLDSSDCEYCGFTSLCRKYDKATV